MDVSRRISIAAALDLNERRRVELLVAVSDPLRLRMLKFMGEPRAVTEICQHLDMAQPRVSHHLSILREAGVIEMTPDGRRRLYGWAEPTDTDLRRLQELLRSWFPADAVSTESEIPTPPRLRPAAPTVRPAVDDIEDYLL